MVKNFQSLKESIIKMIFIGINDDDANDDANDDAKDDDADDDVSLL